MGNGGVYNVLARVDTRFSCVGRVIVKVKVGIRGRDFPRRLRSRTNSLLLRYKGHIRHTSLVRTFLRRFRQLCTVCLGARSLSTLRRRCSRLLIGHNQRIHILSPGRPFRKGTVKVAGGKRLVMSA